MTGTHVMEQLGVNAEQCFMEAVCQAQVRELDLAPQLLALEQWLDKVLQDWHAPEIKSFCAQNSVLVQDLAAIQEQMQAAPTQWTAQWDELKPALNMADIFADKLMFLVFGKFNAGKSSFCNLLVDRCVAQGLPAEYFVLEAGQIQSTAGPFKEGTTETTAHIQGAVLANRLVFIDTPGLHSVTQENADLTQRFLDSADAVLWLSSSTSPGQVQELEELALEIRRRKPLMPIITRSDFLDEDIVDNQIVNVLCNKSADNRALQEADVLCRAQDKLVQLGLDADLIKSPLSVSAYAARSYGLTEQALEDAGIHRFYKAMTQMIPPLLAYKAKKPLAMYLHHLEENVSSDMVKTAQALAAYASVLQTERARLKELTEQLSESIWREVLSHILRLLDAYFAEVNVAEVNVAEVNVAEVNVAEVNVAEVNVAEVNVAEVNVAEVNVAEVNVAEVNVAEVNVAEVNVAEVNVAEVNVAEVNVAEVNVAEVNVAEVNGADCVVITQEEAAASGAQSSSSLATLQLGLTEVLAKEYQTQVQQSLVDMYVLPSHLIEVSEFNGVLIEAYFKQAKVLRADDFEKIYLNLENLASKQIQDNLYNLQQLLDTELEQLQEEVILRQEQLQRSIAHLQAQLPL